jgi:hypothetical protein
MKVEPSIETIDGHSYLASERQLIYWLNYGINTRNSIVECCSILNSDLSVSGIIVDKDDYTTIKELDDHIQETVEYLNLFCLIGEGNG